MPTTFKAVVYADNKRRDGTYNVKIRLTHRRQSLKISTNIYVGAHQLTRSFKIKDQSVADETAKIIIRWRTIVGTLGTAADSFTAKQIVEHIKQTELREQAFTLDFIEYMRNIGATFPPERERTMPLRPTHWLAIRGVLVLTSPRLPYECYQNLRNSYAMNRRNEEAIAKME